MISELAAVVVPVFSLTLAGYAWGRKRLPFDHALVTRLVTLIGAPALVFSSLAVLDVPASEVLRVGQATLVCLALFAMVGLAALRLAKLPAKVYLPSLIFPNIGNMGLPICLFAFGQTGLTLAMIYFAVISVAQFTIGPAIATGHFRLDALARVPFLWATLAALAVSLGGIAVPKFIANTASLAAGLTVPLMLLSLGVALAELKAANLRRTTALSALRLGMGVAVGWGVALAFELQGASFGVLVIQSTMPVALFNFLFARMYDNQPEEVAGMILVSTLMSYAVLPVVVALVL